MRLYVALIIQRVSYLNWWFILVLDMDAQSSRKDWISFWLACHNSVPTPLCCTVAKNPLIFVLNIVTITRPSSIVLGTAFTLDSHICLKDGSSNPHLNLFSACVWFAHENIPIFKLSSHDGSTEDKHVKWNALNHTCTIINVDWSYLGTPTWAGFGGINQNYVGMFHLLVSLAILQVLHTFVTQSFLQSRGLSLGKSIVFEDIVCCTNSSLCINLIKAPTNKFHT